MYLALRPPWAGHGTPPSDAAAVAVAPGDAGVGKPGKKKRVPRGHRPPSANTGGGKVVSGDESGWGGGDTIEEGPDEPQGPARPQLIALSAADRAMEWRGDN